MPPDSTYYPILPALQIVIAYTSSGKNKNLPSYQFGIVAQFEANSSLSGRTSGGYDYNGVKPPQTPKI